jgi:hypothetical protein
MQQKFLNNLHSDKEMWTRFSDILTSDIKFSSKEFINQFKNSKSGKNTILKSHKSQSSIGINQDTNVGSHLVNPWQYRGLIKKY